MKKIMCAITVLLCISLALGYAPDFLGVGATNTRVGKLEFTPQPSILSNMFSLLSPQAIYVNLPDTVKWQSAVNIPTQTFTVDKSIVCKGNYHFITEWYTGVDNGYGYHNSVDHLPGYATDDTSYPLTELDPKNPFKSSFTASGDSATFMDRALFWNPPEDDNVWSVSQYLYCDNPSADVTAPISGKTPNGKPITGAKIYKFNVQLETSQIPSQIAPPVCSAGGVRCKPASNVVQTCSNNKWNDAVDCTVIHSTCVDALKYSNLALAYKLPSTLCQAVKCVPNWQFQSTQTCDSSLAEKSQPGSWLDVNKCDISINKPTANPLCPPINNPLDCTNNLDDPRCVTPPVSDADRVQLVSAHITDENGVVTNKNIFTVFDSVPLKLEIKNPSEVPQDVLIEVGIYRKDYFDKQAPFEGAGIFSSFGRLTSASITISDSCGKRQSDDCKADTFCEETVKNLKVVDVPSNVGASFIDSFGGLRSLPSTWTIPLSEFDFTGNPTPLLLATPNVRSRLADTTFFNGSNFVLVPGKAYPTGDYTVFAYVYDECGSGKVYTPIRKNIKIVCPSSVDEWKIISPESFKPSLTTDNAAAVASAANQLYNTNKQAYDLQINELCVKPSIVETCKNREGDAGIWAKLTGAEMKECISEQNLHDLFSILGSQQMSVDAAQLKLLNFDTAQPYMCTPSATGICPTDSSCVLMKDLEAKGILLPGQVESSFLSNPTFKAGLVGAGIGCAGGLLTKAASGVLGNLRGVVNPVVTAGSKFLYKALPGVTATCLLGGAVGATGGVLAEKLFSGIDEWFNRLVTDPKATLGYCVTEGSTTTSGTIWVIIGEIFGTTPQKAKTYVTFIGFAIGAIYIFKLLRGR